VLALRRDHPGRSIDWLAKQLRQSKTRIRKIIEAQESAA
jgi:hypothetical protein